jgi:V/A-type H+-transporting ATPase subunit I
MDPSPLFAVTFPFFVGLVIGDVGYGILFFLAGWAMRNRARAGKSLEIGMFNLRLDPALLGALSWIIRVLAFWVIVFGVIYAEVFGNLPELFFHVHPIYNRLEEHNWDSYFAAIILLGVLMVYLGLLGHAWMAVRHRHWAGVVESLLMIAASAALFIFVAVAANRLPAAFAPWSLYLAIVSVVLIGVALAMRQMMAPMWLLESFTAFGHILSHVRLMAFGLAAAALALAANQLGEQSLHTGGIFGYVLFALIAGLAQTLFFIFTIIGHLIQPARLHWVEFLMKVKYHQEAGRRYQPLQRVGGG